MAPRALVLTMSGADFRCRIFVKGLFPLGFDYVPSQNLVTHADPEHVSVSVLLMRPSKEVFQELLHTQAASLYYSLFGSISRLLILNHLVACCWYAVGDLGGPTGWVRRSGLESETVIHKYLVCLNWAFAQLSVGSSELIPESTFEFSFCVLVAFRSLITYSTLISTMTSLLSGLSKIKEDENTEFRMLRSYLVHHDICKELQQKITRFLQHQYGLRQQAKSADAPQKHYEIL